MQVWNVLQAARWKCRTQKLAKNHHLGTIAQLCPAISSQQRHVSTIGKNWLSSNISSTCPHNMVNFGQLAAEIDPVEWDIQLISMSFASWQRYCTTLQYWASAKLCGVEQRAPPIFDRAARFQLQRHDPMLTFRLSLTHDWAHQPISLLLQRPN